MLRAWPTWLAAATDKPGAVQLHISELVAPPARPSEAVAHYRVARPISQLPYSWSKRQKPLPDSIPG